MASEKVKVFTDANFGEEVKNGVVLVDFWATWCAPCRRIAPIVDQLAEEYNGKLTVAKVDIDENPMTPSKFMVRGIPTLLLFKNGELKDDVAFDLLPRSTRDVVKARGAPLFASNAQTQQAGLSAPQPSLRRRLLDPPLPAPFLPCLHPSCLLPSLGPPLTTGGPVRWRLVLP